MAGGGATQSRKRPMNQSEQLSFHPRSPEQKSSSVKFWFWIVIETEPEVIRFFRTSRRCEPIRRFLSFLRRGLHQPSAGEDLRARAAERRLHAHEADDGEEGGGDSRPIRGLGSLSILSLSCRRSSAATWAQTGGSSWSSSRSVRSRRRPSVRCT